MPQISQGMAKGKSYQWPSTPITVLRELGTWNAATQDLRAPGLRQKAAR